MPSIFESHLAQVIEFLQGRDSKAMARAAATKARASSSSSSFSGRGARSTRPGLISTAGDIAGFRFDSDDEEDEIDDGAGGGGGGADVDFTAEYVRERFREELRLYSELWEGFVNAAGKVVFRKAPDAPKEQCPFLYWKGKLDVWPILSVLGYYPLHLSLLRRCGAALLSSWDDHVEPAHEVGAGALPQVDGVAEQQSFITSSRMSSWRRRRSALPKMRGLRRR